MMGHKTMTNQERLRTMRLASQCKYIHSRIIQEAILIILLLQEERLNVLHIVNEGPAAKRQQTI